MLIHEFLKESTQDLNNVGIETARLDSLLLLEYATNTDRAKLLAEPDTKISSTDLSKLNNLLKQRIKHIPIAYLVQKNEFYGRDFIITPAVLVPRPESEAMIDELKFIAKSITQPIIVDVGTGSGALGISAKLEVPSAKVTLLDIDTKALKVAQMNVDKFTLDIPIIKSDLLKKLSIEPDVLLCNLPYVPDDFKINIAATHEPRIAIYAGKDGLDLYRKLFQQIDNLQIRPLYLLTESLPTQHIELAALASQKHYDLVKTNDFIQVFKRIQKQ